MSGCKSCHGTNWWYDPQAKSEVPCGCEELLEELAEQSYRQMSEPEGALDHLFAAREALAPLVEEIKRLRARVAELEGRQV